LTKRKTLSVALSHGGIRGGVAHLAMRFFGDPRFLRPASSIDFRHFGLRPSTTLNELIHSLAPRFTKPEIQDALDKAVVGVDELMDQASKKLSFPERWNSGRNLQYLLGAMIILLKPRVVAETGSANGASALAICFGLDHNKFGHLWSFDIEPDTGQLVPDFLRSRVSFIQVSGDEKDFKKNLQGLDFDSKPSIFLHDSDHSYLGQESDYRLAKEMGFDYILSDDIDTSLAFCDFAGSDGQIFYDAPKFIGAVKTVSK
jgi:hypothetical protein